MGLQLVEGVGGGGHLGQGPEGEPAGRWSEHRRGERSGSLEGQAVIDVLGDRPELLAPLVGFPAAAGELDQVVPGSCIAERVHPAKERVGLGRLDEVVEVELPRLVVIERHGYSADPRVAGDVEGRQLARNDGGRGRGAPGERAG